MSARHDQIGEVAVTGRRLVLRSACAPDCAVTITHVNPFGVRATVPAGTSWEPFTGEELVEVEVGDAAAPRHFGHAQVQACTPAAGAPDGTLAVDVIIEPASTTGVLWPLYDQLRNGPDVRTMRPPADWRPPKIPARGHYTESARLERLDWIAEQTGTDVSSIRETSLDAATLTSNVENFVAGVEVPVGLAGPLWFNGEDVQGLVTAPFATTEGALVASATRGAAAISRSGGVTTRVVRQRMMRVPVFIFDEPADASSFVRWLADHVELIRAEVLTVSQRAELIDVDPVEIGNHVHVRFLYETGDAAGQNMTTTATWRACQWISARLDALGMNGGRLYIDGNVSGDKKANFMSFVGGRGIRVIAECILDRQTLVDVLKVTPEQMTDVNAAAMAGTFQIGSIGYDINVANTIGAIFTATGQDIACTHESSLGILTIQPEGDGLRASMTLPALIVGTVGGGTGLPGQRTYLEMLGCAGAGKVRRLAEIIAGFALALDLSTLAAVASGQFANSHERLGRNRPVEWFTRDELAPEMMQLLMSAALDDESLVVHSVADDPTVGLGSSIVTDLTSQRTLRKFVGFAPLSIDVERTAGDVEVREQVDVVVKSKPVGDEVGLMMTQVASACGGSVATEFSRWQRYLGFNQSHTKELHLARERDPRLARIMPQVYGVLCDHSREAYLLVSETLGTGVELKDTSEDISGWQRHHLEIALTDLAPAHAAWLGRTDDLLATDWMGPVPTTRLATEMTPLFRALADHARLEFPEWFSEDDLMSWHAIIDSIPRWWPRLEAQPHTLVHNDFSPRNICLRREPRDGARLVAYDWELATVHAPQRDLAELLAFTMGEPVDRELVDHLVEHHRLALEHQSGQAIDADSWREGYALALLDFMVQRMSLYVMAHTLRDFRFLDRVVHTTRALIAVESERFGDLWSDEATVVRG